MRVLCFQWRKEILRALKGMDDATVFDDENFWFSCPTGNRKIIESLDYRY